MALQKCHECGNDVSTEASNCPKCGAPVKKKPTILARVSAGVGLVIVGLFGIGVISGISKRSPDNTASMQQPVFETTADDIAIAYQQNTVAADSRFKGKTFTFTATVYDISTDIAGSAYITVVGGNNEFQYPHAELAESEMNAAATLQKGQVVRLMCTGNGDVVKTAMLKNCILPGTR